MNNFLARALFRARQLKVAPELQWTPAVIGLAGVLIGSLISTLPGFLGEWRNRDSQEIERRFVATRNIETAAEILSYQWQLHIDSSKKLAGRDVYGIEHVELWRNYNSFPNTFQSRLMQLFLQTDEYLSKKGRRREDSNRTTLRNFRMNLGPFFAVTFFEKSASGFVWKSNPLPAKTLLFLFNEEIRIPLEKIRESVATEE